MGRELTRFSFLNDKPAIILVCFSRVSSSMRPLSSRQQMIRVLSPPWLTALWTPQHRLKTPSSGVFCAAYGTSWSLTRKVKLPSDISITRLTPYDPREGYCLKCTQSALLGLYANLKGNPSAKTEAISHLLDVIHERGPEKTIIYSQFTTMLDSIQAVLKEKKVEYVRCESYFAQSLSTYAEVSVSQMTAR